MPSIFEKIFAASDALQAGKSLKNPAAWKKVQILSPVFLTIIGAAVKVTCGDCISLPDQATIALGLATLAVAINTYLSIATTDKLGFKKKA
jgi:hypothetical protein